MPFTIDKETLNKASELLNSIDDSFYANDKHGLKVDQRTGKVVTADNKELTGNDIFKQLAESIHDSQKNATPADRTNYLFVIDTNHYKTNRQKVLADNMKNFADAGIKNIAIEYPEDRWVRYLGQEGKKFADLTIEEVEKGKAKFIKQVVGVTMETTLGTGIFSDPDFAEKKAVERAEYLYKLAHDAKVNGVDVLFCEYDRDSKGKGDQKKVNGLYQILYENNLDNVPDTISADALNAVSMKLRDNYMVSTMQKTHTPSVIIRGHFHFGTEDDIDEHLPKGMTVAMYGDQDDVFRGLNMTIRAIDAQNLALNRKSVVNELEKNGLTKRELSDICKNQKFDLPEYIYVAKENGGKGALYETKAYLTNTNYGLVRELEGHRDSLSKKSQDMLDEIERERTAQLNNGKSSEKKL